MGSGKGAAAARKAGGGRKVPGRQAGKGVAGKRGRRVVKGKVRA